jgi:hypothetical protein
VCLCIRDKPETQFIMQLCSSQLKVHIGGSVVVRERRGVYIFYNIYIVV